MTKAQFFKFCDTAELGEDYPPLEVRVGQAYREMDHAVFLHGCWCRSTILTRELYRPMPGRQHRDYLGRDAACQKAAKKFQRWLDEWKQRQQPV